MNENYISEVMLNNFRNYSIKKIKFFKDFNVIIGNNGIGKTNLLEAISLFSNSRGLRNGKIEELTNIYKNCLTSSDVLFSLILNFQNNNKILLIQNENKKIIKINDEIIKKSSILNNFLQITFLIPQMDMFFNDSPSIRRKFLDKTAELLFIDHYENVKKYDFFIKERMKILTTQNINDNWLNIIEKKISILGVEIANIRNETIELLNKIFINHTKNFPTGEIKIIGEVEDLLKNNKSIEVEDLYLKKLKENRLEDIKNKKTSFGIHKTDINVIHKIKNISANLCSTGEQKILLISLIIARCIFSKQICKGIPILLLDEICSHIDDNTKINLFKELKNLNIQVFLTGIKKEDFSYLTNKYIEL